MLPHLLRRVDAGIGNVRGIELRDHLFRAHRAKHFFDQCHQLGAPLGTLGVVIVVRIFGEMRHTHHAIAELDPLALVLDAKHHIRTASTFEAPVRDDGRVIWPAAPRRLAAEVGVIQRMRHPFGE